MAFFTYENTVVPSNSSFARMPSIWRFVLVKTFFGITVAGLIAGAFVDRFYWEWVVWFSIFHALVFLALVKFEPMVFPAQLRIVYIGWVAMGTFVPHMTWMMYVTLVGLSANVLLGWCPLARMIYLFPWNRQQPFSTRLFLKTFFSMPKPGRFEVSTA